jgi:hypothetical protein
VDNNPPVPALFAAAPAACAAVPLSLGFSSLTCQPWWARCTTRFFRREACGVLCHTGFFAAAPVARAALPLSFGFSSLTRRAWRWAHADVLPRQRPLSPPRHAPIGAADRGRHAPTGAPGGLPRHAPASALVCRRPRRPRPARGQQPHVDGAGPLRARAARAAAAEIPSPGRIVRARCTRRRPHTRTP